MVAGSRGSLPSGGGGAEQARNTWEGVKTPEVMFFSLLCRRVLFKGCVTGTLPRAPLCCQVRAVGTGRADVGNGVTASPLTEIAFTPRAPPHRHGAFGLLP